MRSLSQPLDLRNQNEKKSAKIFSTPPSSDSVLDLRSDREPSNDKEPIEESEIDVVEIADNELDKPGYLKDKIKEIDSKFEQFEEARALIEHLDEKTVLELIDEMEFTICELKGCKTDELIIRLENLRKQMSSFKQEFSQISINNFLQEIKDIVRHTNPEKQKMLQAALKKSIRERIGIINQIDDLDELGQPIAKLEALYKQI